MGSFPETYIDPPRPHASVLLEEQASSVDHTVV